METKKANISQIRKYLNGELDGPAMHKLEMEALEDLFLMDALEGYENAGVDQQTNLTELTGRLNQRTEEKKRFIIPRMVWPIAASVLLALTIGGLFLNKNTSTLQKQKVAANQTIPPATDTIKVASPNTVLAKQVPLVADNVIKKPATHAKQPGSSVYQQEISAGDNEVAPSQSADATVNQPSSNVAYGYNTPPAAAKPQLSLNEPAVTFGNSNYNKKSDSSIAKLRAISLKKQPTQSLLQGKVDGLYTQSSKDAGVRVDQDYINGLILSKVDGTPVIGAAIRIQGTNKSTVTDANGKFALKATADKSTLNIASIGYEPKQVKAGRGDSVKVELSENNNSLSEVVVTGYGTQKADDANEPAVSAQPHLGWNGLKKYLQENAYLPDGTTGTVVVSFTVLPSGVTDIFTIKKGLNDAANQKAIELLKNGPSWQGNSNRRPEVVTVKVKFQKQK